MTRTALWAGLLLASAGAAFAQPTIDSVSPIGDAETVVVTGSGYGTKPNAQPRVWEDFEDGASQQLTSHGIETLGNTTDNRHLASLKNARVDFKASYASVGQRGYFSYDSGTANRWFVQYWVKLAANWKWGTGVYGSPNAGLANVKYMRFFPVGNRNASNVGYTWQGANAATLRFVETGPGTFVPVNLPALLDTNRWNLIQVEFAENSSAGSADGRLHLWINGALVDSTDSLVSNLVTDGPAVPKRPYVIGFYDSWAPSSEPVTNMYAYLDDIYVDTAWSRVEIGNRPVYGECTVREVQVIDTWADDQLSFKARLGALKGSASVYVFVVDEQGTPSAGHPVSVSAGIPPNSPVNVRISQ